MKCLDNMYSSIKYTFLLIITVFSLVSCKYSKASSKNIESSKDLESYREKINSSEVRSEERGQLAKLSQIETDQLLSFESTTPNLKIDSLGVLVPAYIPEGFSVSSFEAADTAYYQSSESGGLYTYYAIDYESKGEKTCFSIVHYAYDGDFGDGPSGFENLKNIHIPSLDIKADIGYTSFDRDGEYKIITTKMSGNGPQFYIFTSPSQLADNCQKNISITEFVKILKSLQYLDPEIEDALDVSGTGYLIDSGPYYNPYTGETKLNLE